VPEELPGFGGVTLERDVSCRARDGVTLRADVYRPAGPGPHPVLLMRDPYDKTIAQGGAGYHHPAWWARHGYLTVVQDCRGRFRSEGEFVPFANEAKDGYDAVEWAARLDGADGRVAMYGYSYVGAVQLLAAAERPPSLVAICPAFTSPSFHEGWTYRGGALALAFAATWAAGLAWEGARMRGDAAAMDALAKAGSDPGWLATLPLAEMAPLDGETAPFWLDWLEHWAYDDWWRATAVAQDFSRVAVPALHVGGWWDVFMAGTAAAFAGLRAGAGTEEARRGQKLLAGPWHHMPWRPLPGAPPDERDAAWPAVMGWQLRFLDEVVRGRGTGVLAAPATVYVLNDGWRDLDGWPPSQARDAHWFLRSGGAANSLYGDGTLSPDPPGDEPADVYVYDPLQADVASGGHSCCYEAVVPMGPASQLARERWRDVLVYTSEPLAEDLVVAGEPTVTLFAASSAVDTDFCARLCLVTPDGESFNLLEGIVRARFRDSLARASPIVPGRVYEYGIALGPIAVRVPAGFRLRLDVASSDFPQWDRNLNTGGPLGKENAVDAVVAMQTVLHDRARPSRLTLPVVR
jgi:hypothetical protein